MWAFGGSRMSDDYCFPPKPSNSLRVGLTGFEFWFADGLQMMVAKSS